MIWCKPVTVVQKQLLTPVDERLMTKSELETVHNLRDINLSCRERVMAVGGEFAFERGLSPPEKLGGSFRGDDRRNTQSANVSSSSYADPQLWRRYSSGMQ